MADSFFDRLRTASKARDSLLCVGLDPEPARIEGGARGAARHCLEVVQQTAEVACAYKPNTAFWEQYGPDGWKALAEVRAAVPADVPVVVDAKRADVPQTMEAYGRAIFDSLGADAATVHAYHGADSLEAFTRYHDRGVYVVCRTSNPGGRDLQELDAQGQPLYVQVARLAARLNQHGNVGLVVGATAPAPVRALRDLFPRLPFLVPGVGAQGGDLVAAFRAAWNGDAASCLVSVSRTILYDRNPGAAARSLAEGLRSLVTSVQ